MMFYVIFVGWPKDEEDIEEYWGSIYVKSYTVLTLLRLFHADEVQDSFTRVAEKLIDIFYMQRYFIKMILRRTITTVRFVLIIHFFACGWIMIHLAKKEGDMMTVPFVEEGNLLNYFESFYFVTTSITTVGYGDYKGFNGLSDEPNSSEDGDWTIEMIYLYFVITMGILNFSVVTNEIFSYKELATV